MKNAIVVAALFLAVAAVSCKKDKNEDEGLTTFQLITSSNWKIDTIGWDMDKNGVIDGAVSLQDCELDNTLTFSADSTGVFDEGATKCEDADPQTSPFTWTLNDSTKVLTINGDIPGELEGDVSILLVNETNLVLSKRIVTTFPTQFDANLIVELEK